MKKILSLFIVVCLLFSLSTIVLADSGHSTKVVHEGLSSASWELDVPSTMKAGEVKEVNLTGYWDTLTTINVTADEKVSLRSDIDYTTKDLSIEFAGITQKGDLETNFNIIKEISVEEMPENILGNWSGIFTYYVTISYENIEGVAVVDGVGYNTLQEAIDNAELDDTVILLADVEESVTVAENQKITLDLNGHNILGEYVEGLNLDIVDGYSTITTYSAIVNRGTLDIVGNGIVDGRTDGSNALLNFGTVNLYGGTYTRSTEYKGETNVEGHLKNSAYTVLNVGTLYTRDDSVLITTTGIWASPLANSNSGNPSELNGLVGTAYLFAGTIQGGRHGISINEGFVDIHGATVYSGTHEKCKDAIGIDSGHLKLLSGKVISTTGVAITAEGDSIITITTLDGNPIGEIKGEIKADDTVTIIRD